MPAKPPTTSGNTFAAYVPSADRWIPAPSALVAPDGRHYAYNDSSGTPEVDRVHVVDVATGSDHVIAEGSVDIGYEALGYEDDGVYAGRPSQGPGTRPGLWQLDPHSGNVTIIDASHRWSWISHGYAYAVTPNPDDPVIAQGGPVADTLYRLDIGKHTVAQWFRKRGLFVNLRGFDWSGKPVLLLGDTAADLVVLTGQGQVQSLSGGSDAITFSYVYPSLVADAGAMWLGTDQGVLQYTQQLGFQQVWQNPKVKTLLPLVAGHCA